MDMENINSGLILEGGGMRGVYTAGVLDYFIEKNIEFPYVYGVSAGAVNACNYLAKQKGRTLRTNTDYANDRSYGSFYSLITTGDYFGVDMAYDRVPNVLDPFDYDAFSKYQGDFYAVLTNCLTGHPEYFRIQDLRMDLVKIRASSSLPVMSKMVYINGIPYLDGGISDSIPILQSRKDGHKKNVIILTRDKSYRKEPNPLIAPLRVMYHKYPEVARSNARRHIVYNKTLDYIQRLEKAGLVYVIRPDSEVKISKLEKNRAKLYELYQQGQEDAKKHMSALMEFLQS